MDLECIEEFVYCFNYSSLFIISFVYIHIFFNSTTLGGMIYFNNNNKTIKRLNSTQSDLQLKVKNKKSYLDLGMGEDNVKAKEIQIMRFSYS